MFIVYLFCISPFIIIIIIIIYLFIYFYFSSKRHRIILPRNWPRRARWVIYMIVLLLLLVKLVFLSPPLPPPRPHPILFYPNVFHSYFVKSYFILNYSVPCNSSFHFVSFSPILLCLDRLPIKLLFIQNMFISSNSGCGESTNHES